MRTFLIFITLHFEWTSERALENLTLIQDANLDIIAESSSLQNHDKSTHNIGKKVEAVSLNGTSTQFLNSSLNEADAHVLREDLNNATLYENVRDKLNDVNERSLIFINIKHKAPNNNRNKPENYRDLDSSFDPWISYSGYKEYAPRFIDETYNEDPFEVDLNSERAKSLPYKAQYYQGIKAIAEQLRRLEKSKSAAYSLNDNRFKHVISKVKINKYLLPQIHSKNPYKEYHEHPKVVTVPHTAHRETLMIMNQNNKQIKTANMIHNYLSYDLHKQKLKQTDAYPYNKFGHNKYIPVIPVRSVLRPEGQNNFELKPSWDVSTIDQLPVHEQWMNSKKNNFSCKNHKCDANVQENYLPNNFHTKSGVLKTDENRHIFNGNPLKYQNSNTKSKYLPNKSQSVSHSQTHNNKHNQYLSSSDFYKNIYENNQKRALELNETNSKNISTYETDDQLPKTSNLVNDKTNFENRNVNDITYTKQSFNNEYEISLKKESKAYKDYDNAAKNFYWRKNYRDKSTGPSKEIPKNCFKKKSMSIKDQKNIQDSAKRHFVPNIEISTTKKYVKDYLNKKLTNTGKSAVKNDRDKNTEISKKKPAGLHEHFKKKLMNNADKSKDRSNENSTCKNNSKFRDQDDNTTNKIQKSDSEEDHLTIKFQLNQTHGNKKHKIRPSNLSMGRPQTTVHTPGNATGCQKSNDNMKYRTQWHNGRNDQILNKPSSSPVNNDEERTTLINIYSPTNPNNRNHILENELTMSQSASKKENLVKLDTHTNSIFSELPANTDHDLLMKLQFKDNLFKELSENLDELNNMNSDENYLTAKDKSVGDCMMNPNKSVNMTEKLLNQGCVYPECMENAILTSDPNNPKCECEYAIKENMSKTSDYENFDSSDSSFVKV